MAYRRYITEYSNQLHQLLISVSKHYYFGSDGYLKYQHKPMEVNLKSAVKSRREHLLYYVLRDHYSGTFALRIATTKRPCPLADFLYEAWHEGEGEDQWIWGMPEMLYVPKTIPTDGLFPVLEQLGVQPLHPPSGFASGVRILRDIEQCISAYLTRMVDHSLEGVSNLRPDIYRYMIRVAGSFDKWSDGLPEGHPRAVPDYNEFVRLFEEAGAEPFDVASSAARQRGSKQKKQHAADRSDSATEGDAAARGRRRSPGGADAMRTSSKEAPQFSREALERAQEMIYDAWEEPNRMKRLALARKALVLSPYCADAYNLLAEDTSSLEERMNLYQLGEEMGRRAIGDLFFKRNAGHFWGLVETRPYMRSLQGLAESSWESGLRQEAIAHCRELLRLNPNDNQGIRYQLIQYLLAEGMDKEAEELLSRYEEGTCFMLYSEALLAYRNKDNTRAASALREALKSNAHVPPYLLGRKAIPVLLPDFYSPGSDEEAGIYADMAIEAWKETPDALHWMAGQVRS